MVEHMLKNLQVNYFVSDIKPSREDKKELVVRRTGHSVISLVLHRSVELLSE